MTNTLTDDDFNTSPPPQQLETVEWKPVAKGDTMVGTLRRRDDEVDTKFGRKTVLDLVNVTTLTSNGENVDIPDGYGVTLWPTPGAIQVIDDNKVKVGDKFAIRLLDLKDTGKGNPYKDFGVKHLGAGDVFAADKPAAGGDEEPF